MAYSANVYNPYAPQQFQPTVPQPSWAYQAGQAQPVNALEAASGVSYPALMRVLDEHMSALRVVQPREYESVMGRIRALR